MPEQESPLLVMDREPTLRSGIVSASYLTITQVSTQTLNIYSTATATVSNTQFVTQTLNIYATVTVSNAQFATQTATVISTVNNGAPVQYVTVNAGIVTNTVTVSGTANVQTVTVPGTANAETVTVTNNQPIAGQQAQSANSVTIDFIGTLPISPLIFGACAFGAGLFVLLIFSLVCCRNKSAQRKKDEEFDGVGMTTATGMNTTSQRTFTNNSSMR